MQYNSFCNTASGAQDAIAVHRVATMQCLCPVITASANAPAKLNAACVWSRLANGQLCSNNQAGGEYRAQYATLIQLLSDYANTNAKTKTNAIMVQPTIKKHYAYGELVFSKMGNLSSQG